MIKYNIYKKINNEYILIKTVSDIRNTSFVDKDNGNISYYITKVDERGESSYVPANNIILLETPVVPKLIENVDSLHIQVTPSELTPSVRIEKSYDNKNWIAVQNTTSTIIPLSKEDKNVFYRYKTFTTNSISNPSPVVQYIIKPLEQLFLNINQISSTEFTVEWNIIDCQQYRLFINDTLFNTFDNNTSIVTIPIKNNVITIKLEAVKGFNKSSTTAYFVPNVLPEKPVFTSAISKNKNVCLKWKKVKDALYNIYNEDKIIKFSNLKNNTIEFIEEELNKEYTYYITAVNFAGETNLEEADSIKIFNFGQSKPPIIQNIVLDDYSTAVEIIQEEFNDINKLQLDTFFYSDKGIVKYSLLKHTSFNSYIIPKNKIANYYRVSVRYKDSYSTVSEPVYYKLPRPIQPVLKVSIQDIIDKDTFICLLEWTSHIDDMAYSIFRNGIEYCKLPKTSNSKIMVLHNNDKVCVHSHIGYENTESNIVKICYDYSNFDNLKVTLVSIIDKTVKLNWMLFLKEYLLDLFIFNSTGDLVSTIKNYDKNTIDIITPDYGNYYISAKIKLKNSKEYITDFIEFANIETIKPIIPTIIEDTINNELILKMTPIISFNEQLYTVVIKDINTSEIDYINSNNSEIIIEQYDINTKEINYFITKQNSTYTHVTGYSDSIIYDKVNDIEFTATVTQLSNLPKKYGNVIQIDIDDSMSLNKPLVYNIVITTETGERLTYIVSNSNLNDSFIFDNTFDSNFGLNGLPLIVDLKYLVNATISITGYRFNNNYTIKLDYNYLLLPKPTEITKVSVDCQQNLYIYNIEWIQEPKTMYRLVDTKTKKEYEINGSFIHLELEELTQSFLIYSYNISGISNPMVIDIPLLTQPTNINTINGNKEVNMRFNKVSLANEYRLYINNQEYMSTTENNLLLKQFTGEKDIIVRACYVNSVYTILGLPSVYRYTPKTIDNAYVLDYSLINDNKLIRLQIKEDTIEENVKFINFIVLGESNKILYKKILNIPIDDFKFVYEIPNSNNISLIYAELTNGWEVRRTNIIDLSEGIFRFEDNKGNFGSSFI